MHIKTYSDRELAGSIPYPSAFADKYSRGKVVLIGGSEPYPGSICLAGAAAEVSGCGYVEIFCDPHTKPVVNAYRPSLVARIWDGVDEGVLAHENGRPRRAFLVGSGMEGTSNHERQLAFRALETVECALVIDGSAITYLASDEGLELAASRADGSPLIITPHMGEAARLANAAGIDAIGANSQSIEHAQKEELASYALELASAYKATVALKGPDTFVASYGSDEVAGIYSGTAALAKAGTGDVLAGIVASFASQGLMPAEACTLAANIHALSGVIASGKMTEVCVCAEDVLCNIPDAIMRLASIAG